MKAVQKLRLAAIVSGLFLFFSGVAIGPAQGKDMGGWGIDDPYHKLYNAQDVDRIKAVVQDVLEITPLPGMSEGVGLLVEEKDTKDTYLVHVCPVFYKSVGSIGIRKGDTIDLRGVFVEMAGEEVIMAAKIKMKDKVLKVRLTSDGTPFWTLSPEVLQKELMDN